MKRVPSVVGYDLPPPPPIPTNLENQGRTVGPSVPPAPPRIPIDTAGDRTASAPKLPSVSSSPRSAGLLSRPALSFRLFGVPVEIDSGFLLSLLFIAWIPQLPIRYSIATAIIATIALLIHEFGHAAASRACGGKPSIRLTFMIGFTRIPMKTLSWGERIFVIASGPLAGLAAGGAVKVLGGDPSPYVDYWRYFLVHIGLWATIGWSLLNLIPIYPLDGGQLLLGILNGLRVRNANRAVHFVSIVVSIAAVVVALSREMRFTPFIAAGLCYLNVKALRAVTSARVPAGQTTSSSLPDSTS